jgi:hypothetical protein
MAQKKNKKKKLITKPQPKSFAVPVKAKKLPNQNIDKKKTRLQLKNYRIIR